MELPGKAEKVPNVSQLKLFTSLSFGDIILSIFKILPIFSIKQINDVDIVFAIPSKLINCMFNCGIK